MAQQTGNSKRKPAKPRRKLRYLYLNGELHRVLHINRPEDIITMWCYPRKVRVASTYSQVKADMQPAFSSAEVSRMLNRVWVVLHRAIMAGEIEEPQSTVGPNGRRHAYIWSEKDILALREVLSQKFNHPPRKDGATTPPKPLPTEREVRAMIRNEPILYVKTDDETFVPTWKAESF